MAADPEDPDDEEEGGSFKSFAIAPKTNHGGKNDATGAFHPGAQKFSAALNCIWRTFDNTDSGAAVRKRFLDEIDNHCPGSLYYFAYFGHGIPEGLASAHCYSSHLDELMEVIEPKLGNPVIMVLYACSSGALRGYSGKLRERLCRDAWVYGHTTVGHSFMNPDVSEDSSGGSPNYRLMYPLGDDMRGPWADALKYTDLWLRFPLMEEHHIDRELSGRRLMGRWEVTGLGATRLYEFDWQPDKWTGMEFAKRPRGTLKMLDPRKPASVTATGNWRIGRALKLEWDSGDTERWTLPLTLTQQEGLAGIQRLIARRTARAAKLGRLQG